METGLQRAIELAVEAHAGQVDKCGFPYICHCMAVMRYQRSEAAQIAAVLHDVVEDTPVSLADLRRMAFSAEVVAAIDALTHRDEEPYDDYITRVCANRLACEVKIADLEDNLDPRRQLPDRPELRTKYEAAKLRVIRVLEEWQPQGE